MGVDDASIHWTRVEPTNMSARTYALAIQSLGPIRAAIGSRDSSILDGLVANLDENYPELRDYAKDMIMQASPGHEPGCWNYLIEPLASHIGLQVERLPMEDWKHYAVWREYRSVIESQLSTAAQPLLEWLENGRALLGSDIKQDGCTFAWLSTAEAALLLNELSSVDTDEFDDLADFHEELVDALQYAVEHNMELFLGAH